MSELKWNWAYAPYLDPPENQKESAQNAGYVKVVSKDEADKVIADLKDKARHYPIMASIIEDAKRDLLRQAIELRHHKYKRCLAMAGRCRLRGRLFGACGLYEKELWALKWHKRWLGLAEKFKEAK